MSTPPTSTGATTGTPSSSTTPTTTPAAAAAPMFTPTPRTASAPQGCMAMPSRRRVTMSLFRTPSSMAATDGLGDDDSPAGSQDPSVTQTNTDASLEGTWTLHFSCQGGPHGDERVRYQIERTQLSFGNLITMKSRLGYGVRDYLYYKKRCGNAVATLKEINFDADANAMIECNEDEREVRLVLSKEQVPNQNVAITPIKMASNNTSAEDDLEDLDLYKEWLSYLHGRNEGMELGDSTRDQTVQTYKEFLRVEGKLDEINGYVTRRTQILAQINSSQDSNDTTATAHRPAHARRTKQQGNGSENRKKRGRGTLKGYKAITKRIKSGNQKLKVEFSRLGGAVGDNSRTFTDEIVMYTRKRAPLIGVTSWKDIDQDVKEAIVSDIFAKWDIEDNDDTRTKIWTIASQRYKGWRSTFSATYKAYNTYEERMMNKPEDLNIVEWYYLVKYFGTSTFQEKSNKNSNNRGRKLTNHNSGSKGFSQCSYEKKDPGTGEEPNDLELWFFTHTKDEVWTDQVSKDVYDKAETLISETARNKPENFVSQKERNLLFQSAYRDVTQCKTKKLHGNGYMARNPTRRQLLARDNQEQIRVEETLMESFGKFQETVEAERANKEAEREEHRRLMEEMMKEREAEKERFQQELEAQRAEHRRQMEEMVKAKEADKENLKKEILTMLLASQGETVLHQGNNDGTQAGEVPLATSMTEGYEETIQNGLSSPQHNPEVLMQQPENIPPPVGVRTTRSTSNKDGNMAGNFITTQQLKEQAAAARKRPSTKRK